MKKYLLGILVSIVVLAGISSAQVVDPQTPGGINFTVQLPTKNFYVDNAVSSSGDGSSWNKAWKSFANINWSQIEPGNVIYISGGTSSKTYNEQLDVRASGTSGNQITITKGVDAGHNGQVMFDGNGVTADEAIYIRPSSCYGYVTISNLHFKNWREGTIYVAGSSGTTYSEAGAAKGVIIENNNIRIDGRAGIYIQTSNNIIVRNNHLETSSWVNDQTDGIYSQRNHQNLYENNTIIINNREPTGHDDCIQLANGDTDITIRGNYLEQNNEKVSNAQGIMAGTLNGTTRVYNNIINLKSATSSTLNFVGDGEDDAVVEFIGNTVFAKNPWHLYYIRGFDNPVVKNNIGVVTDNSAAPLEIVSFGSPSVVYDPSKISNNLLWNPKTGDIARFDSGNLTQTELVARGINLGGSNENPQFRDPENGDFTPLNSSVCTASDTGSYIGALPCN